MGYNDTNTTPLTECNLDKSTKAFTKLLLVSKLLLASPIRGADATEKLLRNRLARWKAGHIRSLWEDVRGAYQRNNRRQKIQHASPQPNTDERESKLVTEAVLRKVRLLVEGGQLSRACQWLLSRGVALYYEENFAKLSRLFPVTTEPNTFLGTCFSTEPLSMNLCSCKLVELI